MRTDVSVCIPHVPVPARNAYLGEAIKSVFEQQTPAREICIASDHQKLGAAATRQTAMEKASSHWIAFLDDDDYFLYTHLHDLLSCAADTGADYVFSYFVRAMGGDPLGHFGKVFDPENPTHTTVTTLVRRELAMEVGMYNHPDKNEGWSGEDWRFTLGCVDLGAKIVHLPKETWVWRRHQGNTSGMPGRGDAQ